MARELDRPVLSIAGRSQRPGDSWRFHLSENYIRLWTHGGMSTRRSDETSCRKMLYVWPFKQIGRMYGLTKLLCTMPAQLPMKTPECSYSGITPCTSSEHLIRLLVQSHTWNPFRPAPHWWNDACCLKSVREMMNPASEALLYAAVISAPYRLKAALPHTHSYTKYANLGPLYLPLHFWHII